MPGACTTCTATYGSGAKTGMGHTVSILFRIRRVQQRARTACAAAAVGTPPPGTAGRRSGTGSGRRTGTSTWASALPAVPSSKPLSSSSSSEESGAWSVAGQRIGSGCRWLRQSNEPAGMLTACYRSQRGAEYAESHRGMHVQLRSGFGGLCAGGVGAE